MGSSSFSVQYEVEDRSKVSALWQAQIEEDAYESGSGPYAGNATTMAGALRFIDLRLSSSREAEEAVLDRHSKWNPAVAVSFYLPSERTAAQTAALEKAKDKYTNEQERLNAALVNVIEGFRARRSKHVGCPHCESKLSHSHLVQQIGPVSAKTWGLGSKLPKCPLCRELLISETDKTKIDKAERRVRDAKDAYDAASLPPASDKIGWVVGGWAAC